MKKKSGKRQGTGSPITSSKPHSLLPLSLSLLLLSLSLGGRKKSGVSLPGCSHFFSLRFPTLLPQGGREGKKRRREERKSDLESSHSPLSPRCDFRSRLTFPHFLPFPLPLTHSPTPNPPLTQLTPTKPIFFSPHTQGEKSFCFITFFCENEGVVEWCVLCFCGWVRVSFFATE